MGYKKTQTKRNKEVDDQLSSSRSSSGTASEFGTLFVALVFSFVGKPSSVFFISIEAMMDRLPQPENLELDRQLSKSEANLDKLKKQHAEQLEALEQRERDLKELAKATRGKPLLDAPIADLNPEELKIVAKFMDEFQARLQKRKEELLADPANLTGPSTNFVEAMDPCATNQDKASSSGDINEDDDDGH